MSAPLIIPGPPTSSVSKKEAEEKLVAHPQFPKNASYSLTEVEGRWIAAIETKTAAPFPPEAEEGPPSPEGPPSEPESPLEEPEAPEAEEKPKGEKKEKGEKGGELAKIEHLLTVLLTALGLSPDGAEDSPVPGLDEGPPAPPPDAPPGAGDGKTHTVHERAIKPGEAPPGTTPIGTPAFSAVADDHPWKSILGQKRSFTVEEPIGNAKLADVRAEIAALAKGTGYEIRQLREGEENGQRTAKALISR